MTTTRKQYTASANCDTLTDAIETVYQRIAASTDLADVELKADIDAVCAQLMSGCAAHRANRQGLGEMGARELLGKLCVWMIHNPGVTR